MKIDVKPFTEDENRIQLLMNGKQTNHRVN